MREPAADVTSRDAETLLPAVAAALWVWDTLGLEVGEAAAVSEGHSLSRLVALAASWYGASPVLLVASRAGGVPSGVTPLVAEASADSTRQLAERLTRRAGVAAVELSGSAELVDLFLEALPSSSRLLLAGPAREPLTIDYYVNVHRKGLRLVSAVLDDIVGGALRDDPRLARARRLLARSARLEACRQALSGAV